MSAQIEELRVEGDEAPADEKNVWGYLDQRGGLYGWDPDTPFPGYLVLSGAKPLKSEVEYRKAVAEAKVAEEKAQAARRQRGPVRKGRSTEVKPEE